MVLIDVRRAVAETKKVIVKLEDKDLEFEGRLELSHQERDVLLAGGRLNFHRQTLEG
jgi:hypothetical protein